MKWQAAVVGAFASALIATVASAEVRVTNDPGGEITSYVTKFQSLRQSGERLVIDGPCLSACTLFTAFLPPQAGLRDAAGGTRLPCRVLLR